MRKILFVSVWTEDYAPRFQPLVQEVKAHYSDSVFSALFYKVELPGTSIEADVYLEPSPFDFIWVAQGLRKLREYLLLVDETTELFVFVQHVWLFGDDVLFREMKRNVPQAIFLLRNVVSLQNFFTSGEDQKKRIETILRKERKKNIELQVKVHCVNFVVRVCLFFLNLFARFRPHHHQHKILFMRLDVLGDMVLSLPALLALRKAYPNSELTVMASRRSGIIIEEQQRLQPGRFCDRLLYWQASWHVDKERLQTLRTFGNLFYEALRYYREAYDLVIQPVQLGTGIIFAILMCGNKTIAPIVERLPLPCKLDDLVKGVKICPHAQFHIADLPTRCVEAAGVKDVSSYKYTSLLTDKKAKTKIMEELRKDNYNSTQKIIAINIGAGSPTRLWNVDKYALLVNRLKQRANFFPIIIGGSGELELWSQILPHINGQVTNFVGRTDLNQLITLLNMADLIVTPDTGVMHLAAAMDKKIVALFGAGLVPFCKPLCSQYIIVKRELGCSGCHDICFENSEPPCITNITVYMVESAIDELIENKIYI